MESKQSFGKDGRTSQSDLCSGDLQCLRRIHNLDPVGPGNWHSLAVGSTEKQLQTGLQHQRRRVHSRGYLDRLIFSYRVYIYLYASSLCIACIYPPVTKNVTSFRTPTTVIFVSCTSRRSTIASHDWRLPRDWRRPLREVMVSS